MERKRKEERKAENEIECPTMTSISGKIKMIKRIAIITDLNAKTN